LGQGVVVGEQRRGDHSLRVDALGQGGFEGLSRHVSNEARVGDAGGRPQVPAQRGVGKKMLDEQLALLGEDELHWVTRRQP
jgi:ketol-acid reductoisomerase